MPHRVFWRGDVVYDVEKLWALTSHIKPFAAQVSDLLWVLSEDYWSIHEGSESNENYKTDEEEYISAMDVINEHTISLHHWHAIQNADLSFPILLLELTNHTMDVVDGIHRLAKAFLAKHETIPAIIVPDYILKQAIVEKIKS